MFTIVLEIPFLRRQLFGALVIDRILFFVFPRFMEVAHFVLIAGPAQAMFLTFAGVTVDLLHILQYWQAAILAFFPLLAFNFFFQRNWVFIEVNPKVTLQQVILFASKQAAMAAGTGIPAQVIISWTAWLAIPVHIGVALALAGVSFVLSRLIVRL
jgi:putative flippase GtrA